MNADIVASVMIWNATTSVLIPNPIIERETRTSHSMCLNKKTASPHNC